MGIRYIPAAVFVIVNNAPIRASVEDANFYVAVDGQPVDEDIARRGMELLFPDQIWLQPKRGTRRRRRFISRWP